MGWELPRELLWAVIFSLAVTVVAVWPTCYPYAQASPVESQLPTGDHVGDSNLDQHGPAGQTNKIWQKFVAWGEHGEILILGVKPGEWLIFIATALLWWATMRLVKSAERTAQQQLRPFVFIAKGANMSYDQNTGRLSVSVRLENTGVTPAYDFSTWIAGDDFLFDHVPFPAETKPIANRATASIVGPGQGSNLASVNNPMDKCIVEAIREGRLGMFVWGGGDYSDAFGNRWEFVFRARMSGPEDSIQGTSLVWSLHPHPAGYSERQIPRYKRKERSRQR